MSDYDDEVDFQWLTLESDEVLIVSFNAPVPREIYDRLRTQLQSMDETKGRNLVLEAGASITAVKRSDYDQGALDDESAGLDQGSP